MTDTNSQKQMILKHLLKGRMLSQLDALKMFDCFRLASRINDLRNDGHKIETIMTDNEKGKRFAIYKLIKK